MLGIADEEGGCLAAACEGEEGGREGGREGRGVGCGLHYRGQ